MRVLYCAVLFCVSSEFCSLRVIVICVLCTFTVILSLHCMDTCRMLLCDQSNETS